MPCVMERNFCLHCYNGLKDSASLVVHVVLDMYVVFIFILDEYIIN